MGFAMHDLVDPLVRNAELPREFSMRDTFCITGANESIALLDGEGFLTMNITHERFTIRPVREDDRADILSVYRQCEDFLALGPVPQASMAMVQADLDYSTQHGGIFCGIFDPGGGMMGVIDVIPKGYEGEPHTAFLTLLMIRELYRAHGLGTAVVQAAEQYLVAQHTVDTIRAGVAVNNPGAIRFWARQGYVTVSGPIVFPDGTGFDLCKSLR